MSIDRIVQLPLTTDRYDAIFTVVDCLTKIIHRIPTKTTDTATELCMTFLTQVVCLHDFPTDIVSDKDPLFTSHFWSAFFKAIGTKLATCPPHTIPKPTWHTSLRTIALQRWKYVSRTIY
jgi:hypothetical protein